MNDFSRFTWVLFLIHKNEGFQAFSKFCENVQNKKGFVIICRRSDHEREFEIFDFETFASEHRIEQKFWAP